MECLRKTVLLLKHHCFSFQKFRIEKCNVTGWMMIQTKFGNPFQVSLPKFAHRIWKSAPWCAAVVFVKCFHHLLLSVRNVDSRKCANWCCCTYFDLVLLTSFAFFIPAHQEEGAKFGQNITFSQFQIILYCIFWRLSEVGREREEKSNLSVAQCTMHSALCARRI